MNKRLTGFGVAVIGAAALMASIAVAAPKGHNALVGSWQFDPAKSTFTGRAPYASGKLVISSVKEGIKTVIDVGLADGKVIHTEYTGPQDGTDLPATGSPNFDSVSVIWPDKQTSVRTERRAGKVVGVTTVEVAKDGKSFTGNSRGTLPDGHQYTSTTVWIRTKK